MIGIPNVSLPKPVRTWTVSAACFLFLGLISCAGPDSAFAQPKIIVVMKDGKKWEQPLTNIRKVVYQSPNLVFTLVNGTTNQILHADVGRITFSVPVATPVSSGPSKPENTSSSALLVSDAGDGMARLSLSLAASMPVRLEVRSLDGAKVKTLADGNLSGGNHTLAWDGRDDNGRAAGPGAFLFVATTAGRPLARKILRLGQALP